MELFTRLKKRLSLIDEEAQRAGEAAANLYIDNYIFSRNAPPECLEAKLINELSEVHQEWEKIPAYEVRKKKLAKEKLDEAANKVLEAHKDFLARGGKYITPSGQIIE